MAPRRGDLGSWLEGTPGDPEGRSGLGLPSRGRGSVAGLGRRIAALGIDWFASLAVTWLFFPDPQSPAPGLFSGDPTATLAVFAASTAVLVSTLGSTIGHRVLGLQVVRVRDLGRPDGWPAPGLAGVLRTVLLALVIPAAIWDRDGRGMHDAAAGTVLVRR